MKLKMVSENLYTIDDYIEENNLNIKTEYTTLSWIELFFTPIIFILLFIILIKYIDGLIIKDILSSDLGSVILFIYIIIIFTHLYFYPFLVKKVKVEINDNLRLKYLKDFEIYINKLKFEKNFEKYKLKKLEKYKKGKY